MEARPFRVLLRFRRPDDESTPTVFPMFRLLNMAQYTMTEESFRALQVLTLCATTRDVPNE